jgi:hypothetical protein
MILSPNFSAGERTHAESLILQSQRKVDGNGGFTYASLTTGDSDKIFHILDST